MWRVIVVGAINGASASQMITEFQQSLYWLAAPFFALMLQSERDVQRAARLVRIAGVTLACIYIGILIGLLAGIIHLGVGAGNPRPKPGSPVPQR